MGIGTVSVLTKGRTPSQLRDSGGVGIAKQTRTALSSCGLDQVQNPSKPNYGPLSSTITKEGLNRCVELVVGSVDIQA
jgi:hypothetical protein